MKRFQTHLSEFLYLEAGSANDAASLALVDQQAQLAIKVQVFVLLILELPHKKAVINFGPAKVAENCKDEWRTSSNVGMTSRRMSQTVPRVAPIVRILKREHNNKLTMAEGSL